MRAEQGWRHKPEVLPAAGLPEKARCAGSPYDFTLLQHAEHKHQLSCLMNSVATNSPSSEQSTSRLAWWPVSARVPRRLSMSHL